MPDNFDLERRVIRLEEWRLTVQRNLDNLAHFDGDPHPLLPTWGVVLLSILFAFLIVVGVALLARGLP